MPATPDTPRSASGPDAAAPRIEVVAIYLSPGHNFFGHHGRPPGDHAMARVESAEAVAGRGLVGDRFFDYKENYKGQVTLFAIETWRDLCATFGVRRDPSVFRRNLLVRGVDLNSLIDRAFSIGGVRLHGIEEARPCYWMNGAFCEGAEEALRGRGGLRARILEGGTLRVTPGAAEEAGIEPLVRSGT